MQHATSIYDVVRIDHFRALRATTPSPPGTKRQRAATGKRALTAPSSTPCTKALGEGGIIAEDLGYLTPEVKAMLAASGYPGMKIMQFAFDSREPGNYLPYTYPANSVVYTGTHDNVTTEGWRSNASAEDVAYACRYLRCTPETLTEGHDLRLPCQCFGYGHHPAGRLAASGQRGPHQHPQHPGCQLAVAAGAAPTRRTGRPYCRADPALRPCSRLTGTFQNAISSFLPIKPRCPPCSQSRERRFFCSIAIFINSADQNGIFAICSLRMLLVR